MATPIRDGSDASVAELWIVRCGGLTLVFDREFMEAYTEAVRLDKRQHRRRRVVLCEPCEQAHRDGVFGAFLRPARWRIWQTGDPDPTPVCQQCADAFPHYARIPLEDTDG